MDRALALTDVETMVGVGLGSDPIRAHVISAKLHKSGRHFQHLSTSWFLYIISHAVGTDVF